MGLREKRIIHQLQNKTIPAYEAAWAKKAGTKIKLQVDWDSFSDCNEEILERVERFGLKKISEAIDAVCVDNLGKEAIQDGLKAIDLKHVPDRASVAASMANTTLKVCVDFSDIYKGYVSEFTIQEVLENGL
ncbi:hypothetical protein IQ235_10490 [Oscillatoriales cyanobacterium LEGE 11467]|uniref:Uncharacterized protein n=1 Tax=Zarconia navalis LEGE 11467 TaxID=1828826 RepID=A0A928VZJ8_9CYAN|nr:hypothetical protein [Zarconia navalis]MBE9041206.1 hypothetical protein [Zarconia navalis LEGE 11467]